MIQSISVNFIQTLSQIKVHCASCSHLTSKNLFFITPDKIPDADSPIIRTRGKFLISGTKAANIQK